MKQTMRMVVGLDLESDGDVALREALSLAERMGGAELHLVHVVASEERNTELLSQTMDMRMSALRDRIEREVAPGDADLRIRLHVRFGDVASALNQMAIDYDADLLVVGTHGLRGLERVLAGSVVAKVLKEARLPVIVARAKSFAHAARTPVPESSEGADPTQKHIVSESIRVGPRSTHIAGLL
jgi:nucleotide-binding universal stress UspA family protein